MGVLVDILHTRLMDMRMGVRHPIVGVLVLVDDVLMVMRGVRMDVCLAVMFVLMDVKAVVRVVVFHIAPVIA